jgi:hypothetical protein
MVIFFRDEIAVYPDKSDAGKSADFGENSGRCPANYR